MVRITAPKALLFSTTVKEGQGESREVPGAARRSHVCKRLYTSSSSGCLPGMRFLFAV